MNHSVQPRFRWISLSLTGLTALLAGTMACSLSPSTLAPLDSASSLGLGQSAQAQTDHWPQLEQDIVAFQNQARQNPASLIPLLEARLAAMNEAGEIVNGCGRRCNIATQEGKSAVQEAIDFLRNQEPLSPLEFSAQVALAAQTHADDQADGATGHTGSDGSRPSDRLDRAGALNSASGENIAYGSPTGQEVILDLIVDDGVPGRGHRVNIFTPRWTRTGAGCGPHATYGLVCVINYITFSPQITIDHRGTVALESLTVEGQNLLASPLAPGRTQTIPLNPQQCKATLDIQLQGYNLLQWPDLSLCGATLTIEPDNGFELGYPQ
ncbi:MAG: CAP domain-containing protein [Spirulina sp.]